MSSLQRDLEEALAKTLRQHGVMQWDVIQTRKHLKWRFRFRDREITYVSSATCSDDRAVHNAVSDLRKVMGVTRPIHKNAANRQKSYRKPPPAALRPPSITVLPDPWEKLKALRISRETTWQKICRIIREKLTRWKKPFG